MSHCLAAMEQALEALKLVGDNLVPDYGSGHYAVQRQDKPRIDEAISDLEATIEEMAANPTSAPEGWQLVPKEPINNMLEHVSFAASLWEKPMRTARQVRLDHYRDLLAKAPKLEDTK